MNTPSALARPIRLSRDRHTSTSKSRNAETRKRNLHTVRSVQNVCLHCCGSAGPPWPSLRPCSGAGLTSTLRETERGAFQRECKLKDDTGLSSRPAPENVLSFADSDNAVKCCILPINLPCCSLPVTKTFNDTDSDPNNGTKQTPKTTHKSLERDKNKPAKGGILNPKPGVRPVPQPEPCPLHARHRWAGRAGPAPVFGTEAESILRDSLTSAHINTYTHNRCACVCLHNMCTWDTA